MTIRVTDGEGWDLRLERSWVSPVYGRKDDATRLVMSRTCEDCRISYEIDTRPERGGDS